MCRVMEEKFNQGVRHGMELGIQQGHGSHAYTAEKRNMGASLDMSACQTRTHVRAGAMVHGTYTLTVCVVIKLIV